MARNSLNLLRHTNMFFKWVSKGLVVVKSSPGRLIFTAVIFDGFGGVGARTYLERNTRSSARARRVAVGREERTEQEATTRAPRLGLAKKWGRLRQGSVMLGRKSANVAEQGG